jgi:5-methylcytosine-specific restriction endonuclease McrA
MTDIHCATCDKLIFPQKPNRPGPRYCSLACAGKAKRIEGARWRDPAAIKEYLAAYTADNRDRHNERSREYYAAHKEKLRASKRLWAFRNREKVAAASERRAAAAVRSPTPAKLQALRAKSHGRCVYCGRPSTSLQIDHIVPIAKGGRSNIKNLIPCCPKCNRSKMTSEVSDWLFRTHGEPGLVRALAFLTKKAVPESLFNIIGGRK